MRPLKNTPLEDILARFIPLLAGFARAHRDHRENTFSIAVDPALERDRFPGNGKTLSSLRCKKITHRRFFRDMVAILDDILPEGLCHFDLRLSTKSKIENNNFVCSVCSVRDIKDPFFD